jgi:hypothetical protein
MAPPKLTLDVDGTEEQGNAAGVPDAGSASAPPSRSVRTRRSSPRARERNADGAGACHASRDRGT